MRVPLTIAALITASMSLAACGSSASSGEAKNVPEGFMTLQQTQDEYDRTVAGFPYDLPDGRTFPARVQQPAESTVYQKGGGLVQAYQFWECAWMDQYLTDQSGDTAAATAALDHLRQGTSSIYRTQYVIDDDGNWSTALRQAGLGDPSLLAAFSASDCTWYRTEAGR